MKIRKIIICISMAALFTASLIIFSLAANTVLSENDYIESTVPKETQGIENIVNELKEDMTEEVIKPSNDWNILETKKPLYNVYIDEKTGKPVSDEGFTAITFLPVNTGEKCAFYSKSDECRIIYYNEFQQYLKGEIISASEGKLLQIPSECRYVTVSMHNENVEESFFVQEKSSTKELIIVAAEDESYSSINKAVSDIRENGVIIVLPGIYNENVKAWGKKVTIYGADREKCILESNSGNYYTPPLEISAGYVKNMTIRAADRNTQPSSLPAYGVHIEDHYLFNNTLTFETCTIYSDFNSAVGIGLRGGCSVEFIDVKLIGKENGLFCHDSAYSKYTGVQDISLINCIVEGMEGENAIRFDSQGVNGAVVNVLFINNILKNNNAADEETLLYTRNNNGKGTSENWMGLKNYYIREESCGNNIEELNY